MDIRKNLNDWLKNPKRDYASGLSLFNLLARPNMKKDFGSFLNAVNDEDRKPNSMKMNMLTNKLTQINRAMELNPALFAETLSKAVPSTAEIVKEIINLKTKTDDLGTQLHQATYFPELINSKKTDINTKKEAVQSSVSEKDQLSKDLSTLKSGDKPSKEEIEKLEAAIQAKDEEIESLNLEIQNIEDEVSDLEEKLSQADNDKEDLQRQFSESTDKVEELKEQLEQKGLKVLTDEDLPEELQQKRLRIKDIIPLMAAIHSEISIGNLSDDERQEKADELCNLDDERRSSWDAIDDYLGDNESVIVEERKLEYSQDPVIRGTQIANRILRLKENIARSEKSAKDNKERKPNIATKAEKRAEKYKKELEELENQLNGNQ